MHSSIELGRFFLEEATFLIVIDKAMNKKLSEIIFRATVGAATVLNRVRNFGQVIDRVAKVADHIKWVRAFFSGGRSAHPPPPPNLILRESPRGRG